MTNINTVNKEWSDVSTATITAHTIIQVKDQPETRDLIARLVFCDGLYDQFGGARHISFRENVLLATDAISDAYSTWQDGYVEVQVTFTNRMVNG